MCEISQQCCLNKMCKITIGMSTWIGKSHEVPPINKGTPRLLRKVVLVFYPLLGNLIEGRVERM